MKKRLLFLVSGLLVLGLTFGMTYQQRVAATVPGVNQLIAVDSSGTAENAGVWEAGSEPTDLRISNDGRYVVFASSATNLTSSDTNAKPDAFIRDTQANTTTLVSASTAGTPSDGGGVTPIISYDGRYVLFESSGDDIVSGVSGSHIYRRDTSNGSVAVVDATAAGVPSAGGGDLGAVSADGRFVAFTSSSSDLTGSGSGYYQIILKDMDTGAVQVISKTSTGTVGNLASVRPSISCDGNVVAFLSNSSNLSSGSHTPDDDLYVAKLGWAGNELVNVTAGFSTGAGGVPQVACNGNTVVYSSLATDIVSPNTISGVLNVYEYNRLSKGNVLVSQSSSGVYASGSSTTPSVSDNGRFVAFESASDLDTAHSNPLHNSYNGIFVRDIKNSTTDLVNFTYQGWIPYSGANPSISADGSYVAYTFNTPNTNPGDDAQSLISGLTSGTSVRRWDMYESKTGF